MPHGSVHKKFSAPLPYLKWKEQFFLFPCHFGEVQGFLTLILCNGTEGEGEDGIFLACIQSGYLWLDVVMVRTRLTK